MLGWVIGFLVLAIIAPIFAFAGIASAAVGIAKILLVFFLALFVVFMYMGRRRV
jgi:uncharacterized membrane protein YtjA (UPF0391 family)